MIKTWQRYYFLEALKVLIFFLACFFFLYVMIDYSVHLHLFRSHHLSGFQILLYYLFHFSTEANILIPAALLLATVKGISSANQKRELVALQSGGICKKALTIPFIWLACFSMLFLYANSQWLLPSLQNHLQTQIGVQIDKKHLRNSEAPIQIIQLSDQSKIVYGSVDETMKRFSDVFWIVSTNELYHMKTLEWIDRKATGYFVDHFIGNDPDSEFLHLNNFSEQKPFPELTIFESKFFEIPVSPNFMPISELVHRFSNIFLYKLLLPLSCLLVVIIPARYCMTFTRKSELFLLYGLSIFSFICFQVIVQSMYILTLGQIASSLLLLGIPFIVGIAIALRQLIKL